jgi:cell wall-associated NlpC family hydrolase
MKINKKKAIAFLFVAILIVLIPLGEASPVMTSESATVKAAQGWIGVKELTGGNSRSGIDCSHLVYQVYKQVGAKGIVFETVANMKKDKYYVTTKSPRPGDVIFWKKAVTENGKKYWLDGHVGIYIGNGKFIDSSDVLRKVTTETITWAYKDGLPYYARWSHK